MSQSPNNNSLEKSAPVQRLAASPMLYKGSEFQIATSENYEFNTTTTMSNLKINRWQENEAATSEQISVGYFQNVTPAQNPMVETYNYQKLLEKPIEFPNASYKVFYFQEGHKIMAIKLEPANPHMNEILYFIRREEETSH